MKRRVVAFALALLFSIGCKSKSAGPAPVANRSTPGDASSLGAATGSADASSNLRAQTLVAGYGGVGPATPAPRPDTWVVLLLDVETDSRLLKVKLTDLELFDKAGKVVARAKLASRSVRRDLGTIPDDARRKGDFSEKGTMPFNGVIEPGRVRRLHVRAPLDKRADTLGSSPVRFRVRITAPDHSAITVEGKLQPRWPSG